MTVPNVRLNNGVSMPQLGFGVFQVPDAETETAVTTALEVGYRSIDTAAAYGNEAGVGAAIAKSGIPRKDLFITTKLWNSDHGYDSTLRAFDKSLDLLGLDQLDLYLIHWPRPKADKFVETWRAFEKLLADGRTRAIGVSNFQPAHLRRVLDETGTVPAVNQIELHPYLTQAEPRAFHEQHKIATESWSPLAKGGDLLKEPLITSLAEKYARTAAQIVLRWHVQLGNVVIPKSVTPSRVKENFEIWDFELADDDVEGITAMDSGLRTGPDPDEFN
jgi:diketogulonate reductase-like aldo/keto reductase